MQKKLPFMSITNTVFLHCIFKKSERIVECISLPAPTRCDIINVWRVENGFK